MRPKALLGAAVACVAGVAGLAFVPPAKAGSGYKHEVDRFTGTKTSTYDPTVGSECKLTKSMKSRIYNCFLINSTESSIYPSIAFMAKADGWDVLRGMSTTSAPAIIKFKDGTEKFLKLPVKLSTDTLYGGTVSETLYVRLGSIRSQLPQVERIEVQFHSNEYLWVPDHDLVEKNHESCTVSKHAGITVKLAPPINYETRTHNCRGVVDGGTIDCKSKLPERHRQPREVHQGS